MKFALLEYRNTDNLGDEIQSLAARRFLPRVDRFVDRDFLSESHSGPEDVCGLILNGWFADRPENWPPPEWVVPLLISFHIATGEGLGKTGLTGKDVILDANLVSYLRRWGPIGARDITTLRLLEAADVPAYLSGCLTLTLQRDDQAVRGDDVVLVDLPPEVVERFRWITERDIIVLTHGDTRTPSGAARLARAEHLLATYQRAHCVVTSRLHAALPCLAYETPVLLVESEWEPARLDGLRELLRHCSQAELLAGDVRFDLDEPGPNDADYLRFRRSLEEKATGFVEQLQVESAVPSTAAAVTLEDRVNTLWGLLCAANGERESLRHRLGELEGERSALTQEVAAMRDRLALIERSRTWRFRDRVVRMLRPSRR